jgi:hypothetical protein
MDAGPDGRAFSVPADVPPSQRPAGLEKPSDGVLEHAEDRRTVRPRWCDHVDVLLDALLDRPIAV